MGRRGPPPKPTRLRILEGNPGRRPLNDREPKPRDATPVLPAWLSPDAKTEWRRIVPELRRLGLLTLVDRAALAAYCQAWAELQIATRLLEKEGRIVEVDVFGKDGAVTGSKSQLHPAVKLQRDAFGRVKQFLAEFGLTPASRARLNAPGPAKEADPFEEYLQRGRSDQKNA